MLIDDENIRVQYDSTAESPIMAGDALPFPFRFIEKEQVKAILLDGTKLIFNEDYTVGLEEEEEEKPEGEDEASVSSDYTSVILNIDIPVGETITLYRETDLDQTSEFPQEARFSSRKIEDALDKLTMQNQEQREALGRAMKLPLTAAVDLKDLALPNPEPNKSVKWNSDGTALVNTSFDPDTALVTTENFKKQAEQSAKDSASSAAASANSATVAGQKVNEITALHSDYMDDINTTSTNYLNQINSRSNTIIKDADAIINRVGLNMFDTVIKDHVLTYPDGQGLALQGTWVYRDAKAGERYGYPDFYERCVKEFKESTTASENNVTVTGTLTNNNGVISGFSDANYAKISDTPSNLKSFELFFKCTTGSDFTNNQLLYGQSSNTNYATPQLQLGGATNQIWCGISPDGATWVTVCNKSNVIQPNTTYYCKLVWSNGVAKLYVATTKNITEQHLMGSAKLDTATWSIPLGLGYDQNPGNGAWLGSIDLNECYININDSRWWDGVRLRRHSNGHYYYPISAKATIDSRFNSNGAAWYYGVDEANKRIFLPRNNWFMQMASNSVGSFTDAGLPNITGTLGQGGISGTAGADVNGLIWAGDGSFYITNTKNDVATYNPSGKTCKVKRVGLNASRSSAVYGKSSTVQPKSVKHLLYICVGNQVQTDSWVDTITQVKNGAKEIDDSVQGAIADVEQAKDECIEEIGTKTAELTSKMAFSMFDAMLKDHKLVFPYDQGFALQGTYVYHDADPGIRYGYPDFYNKCIEEKNKATSSSVTLGSNTVTIWTHSNGHMYYDISEKSKVDTFFNSMGVAWYYGIDTTNKRIFLPRNNYLNQYVQAGNYSVVGNGKTIGFTDGSTNYGLTVTTNTENAWAYRTAAYNTSIPGTTGNSGNHPGTGARLGLATNATGSGVIAKITTKTHGLYLYICVGNRVQDTSWVDVVTQVSGGVKTINDCIQTGLKQLTGASTAITRNNITGCIISNPKKIDLVFDDANHAFRLKAGSIVLVPYGTENLSSQFPKGAKFLHDNYKVVATYMDDGRFFVEAQTVSDVSTLVAEPISDTAKRHCVLNITNNYISIYVSHTSSAEASTTTGNCFHYRTDLNLVQRYTSGALSAGVCAFPIARVQADGTYVVGRLLQVFQGIGFIGSTVWTGPDIKMLLPYGISKDGSFTNLELTTNTVKLRTDATSKTVKHLCFYKSNNIGLGNSFRSCRSMSDRLDTVSYQYIEDVNQTYVTNRNYPEPLCIIADIACNGTIVTDLFPAAVYRGENWGEYAQKLTQLRNEKAYITETYVSGTSWYRIWSDGWKEQGGKITISSAGATVKLLKTMSNTSYHCSGIGGTSPNGNTVMYGLTTSSFQAWVSDDSSFNAGILFWEVKGY